MIDVKKKKKDIIAVKWLTTNVHSVSNAIIRILVMFLLYLLKTQYKINYFSHNSCVKTFITRSLDELEIFFYSQSFIASLLERTGIMEDAMFILTCFLGKSCSKPECIVDIKSISCGYWLKCNFSFIDNHINWNYPSHCKHSFKIHNFDTSVK